MANKIKTVLVVDDDTSINEVVKIILEESGYRTVTALNGTMFREALKTSCPDLVLLDIWLGKEDGRDLASEMRSKWETKAVPIIVLSAGSEIPKLAKEMGADGYLNKPFDIDDLVKVVTKYIGPAK